MVEVGRTPLNAVFMPAIYDTRRSPYNVMDLKEGAQGPHLNIEFLYVQFSTLNSFVTVKKTQQIIKQKTKIL